MPEALNRRAASKASDVPVLPSIYEPCHGSLIKTLFQAFFVYIMLRQGRTMFGLFPTLLESTLLCPSITHQACELAVDTVSSSLGGQPSCS